jgi:Flp pilus assembly protein TadB
MLTQETEHGVGSAAKNVAEHASTLARLELELALLEVKRKVAALGVGIGMSIAAGVFALFALGFGLAAAAVALALVLPMWASLLIVCGALVLLAVILLFAGMGSIKKGAPPVPEQAIREAKLTTEAIRNGRS